MGWKGDRCWHCRADLAALMALTGLPDEWDQMRQAEFDRHMLAECVSDPRTDFERVAVAEMAAHDAAMAESPGREDHDRLLIDAASRERKLREVLGAPPEGSTWLDHFQQLAGEAPLLTQEQKARLALLLGSVRADCRPATAP